MSNIEYFKLQANNLFEDWKTKFPVKDDDLVIYQYNPKYFDMDEIVCTFDIDEDNFNLIEAQDIIAILAGFEDWSKLTHASETNLEIGKLLLDNRDRVTPDDWWMFIGDYEELNNTTCDEITKLSLCEFWLNEIV